MTYGQSSNKVNKFRTRRSAGLDASVSAAELFAMVHGFDVGSVLKATLTKMLGNEAPIPLILATDSKSL
jgi:hypothetical protein